MPEPLDTSKLDLSSLDDLQRDLLADPQVAHVPLGGVDRPFLLCLDGCERAAIAGHDPLPALFSIVLRFLEAVKGGGKDVQDVEITDARAVFGVLPRLKGVLTTETVSDFAVVLWAGLLPFDRGLRFEEVKARLTLPAVVGIGKAVYPKLLAFASEAGLSEASDLERSLGKPTTAPSSAPSSAKETTKPTPPSRPAASAPRSTASAT